MKQLAIPLSNQKTVAKWLVMSSKLDVDLTQPQALTNDLRRFLTA